MSNWQIAGAAIIGVFFIAMFGMFSWMSGEWWVGPMVAVITLTVTAVLIFAVFLISGWTP